MFRIFSQIEASLSLKSVWLSLIFFSDANNPCQNLLFPRTYKPRKNLSVSAGTILKKPEFLGPSRDAQNACAVAKAGTVLNSFITTLAFFYRRISTVKKFQYLSLCPGD